MQLMIGTEAALAVFLLFWLNTPKVRSFFHSPKESVSLSDPN